MSKNTGALPTPPGWRLDVRGLGLQIWELGIEDEPAAAHTPVICLHGWLDQGLAFAPMASFASRQVNAPKRWLGMDQRGFGHSEGIPGGAYPHFADYIGDVDALVETLGRPVDLVGHSMGGTVAAYYAGARPEMVRRMVLVEGMGTLEQWQLGMLEQLRAHLKGLRTLPRAPWNRSVENAAERLRRRHPGLSESHAVLLAETGTHPDGDGVRWSFDPLHLTRGAYPFIEGFFLEVLSEITAPTLVIWATESWYPKETQELRTQAIPGVEVAQLQGGHMLPYDDPEGLAALIIAHLGSQEP